MLNIYIVVLSCSRDRSSCRRAREDEQECVSLHRSARLVRASSTASILNVLGFSNRCEHFTRIRVGDKRSRSAGGISSRVPVWVPISRLSMRTRDDHAQRLRPPSGSTPTERDSNSTIIVISYRCHEAVQQITSFRQRPYLSLLVLRWLSNVVGSRE